MPSLVAVIMTLACTALALVFGVWLGRQSIAPEQEAGSGDESKAAAVDLAFRPDQLLAARHDHPDTTGPVVDWEPVPEES